MTTKDSGGPRPRIVAASRHFGHRTENRRGRAGNRGQQILDGSGDANRDVRDALDMIGESPVERDEHVDGRREDGVPAVISVVLESKAPPRHLTRTDTTSVAIATLCAYSGVRISWPRATSET